MIRKLRFVGLLLLNLVVALIGTAILDTAIGKVLPSHSLGAVLWKEWILSITCAFFVGFGMWRTWRSEPAKWAWVLPAAWFGFRFLFAVTNGQLWFQFSGSGCGEGLSSLACRNFFVFTIPLLRGVSYSAGAYVSSRIYAAHHLSHAAESGSASA